jgi:phosphatidylethanolamine/phosphatidyl-N-methylethanolamine N-methyltransferase
MPLLALQVLVKKLERRIRRFEQRNGVRLLDEMAFIRSWIEKPISMGAVTPSGRMLARTMARYVDPDIAGPVIELGPGTGAVTKALRQRYPDATVIQGDAYRIGHLLGGLLKEPAAAVVSGLPLQTKPFKRRLQLMDEAFGLMAPDAPLVQFTYAMVSPIPMRPAAVSAHASELIWQNLPPARVWVYRKTG